MKNLNFLRIIAYVFILMFPISFLYALHTEIITFAQKNISVIFGLLFCIIGLIILKFSNAEKGSKTEERKKVKRIWVITLIVNIVIIFIMLMPIIEAYLKINMPFVQIDSNTFTVFGCTESNPKRQEVYLFIIAVFMMIPIRLVNLSIARISDINTKEKDEVEWRLKAISEQMERDSTGGY